MSAPAQKIKAYEIRKNSEAELLSVLESQRRELVGLRTSKVASAPQIKLARIKVVRKNVAKLLTVMNEKRRTAAKSEWKDKKYTPKDLRTKGTKASRKGLTNAEKKVSTLKAQKKAANFRLRKYAVAN